MFFLVFFYVVFVPSSLLCPYMLYSYSLRPTNSSKEHGKFQEFYGIGISLCHTDEFIERMVIETVILAIF